MAPSMLLIKNAVRNTIEMSHIVFVSDFCLHNNFLCSVLLLAFFVIVGVIAQNRYVVRQ